MKFIALFLVLSMVVIMAEPGEAFFHHIIGGLFHGIHGLITGKQRDMAEQRELEQRAYDRERAFT